MEIPTGKRQPRRALVELERGSHRRGRMTELKIEEIERVVGGSSEDVLIDMAWLALVCILNRSFC